MQCNWHPDQWETPNEVAQILGGMVKETDQRILEPAAGTGQILQFLPKDRFVTAVELDPVRWSLGFRKYPWAIWLQRSFLDLPVDPVCDLVITNPPFSLGMEFIRQSIGLINHSSDSRAIFLLPVDYFCSQARFDALQQLDCHISGVRFLRGRVAYLKHGIPVKGRQIYDAIWTLKRGRKGSKSVSFAQPLSKEGSK